MMPFRCLVRFRAADVDPRHPDPFPCLHTTCDVTSAILKTASENEILSCPSGGPTTGACLSGNMDQWEHLIPKLLLLFPLGGVILDPSFM